MTEMIVTVHLNDGEAIRFKIDAEIEPVIRT